MLYRLQLKIATDKMKKKFCGKCFLCHTYPTEIMVTMSLLSVLHMFKSNMCGSKAAAY